jgi:7,8-dihydropterin-6-yl-methyl-4-(beta-D-ribofuranosyl)aminobenzene 5'-phosphate synthase
MKRLLRRCLLVSTCLAATAVLAETRITILSDAFGKPDSRLARDWGYSALVEHEGKRILFDTGNNAEIFEQNVEALKVDLARLDAVVISHRHGDHTAGLHYLRRVNPYVQVFVPADEHFGGPTPAAFFRRKDESLPSEMRYFGGKPPQVVPHGSAWRGFSFVIVDKPTEIIAGVRVIPAVSRNAGTMELQELSLSVQTEAGQIVLVGCSHPGILNIVEAVAAFDPRIHLVAGGLHLVTTDETEVQRIATDLRNKWSVKQIAPGHCTGEHAFAVLKRTFGDQYIYAGVGTVIQPRLR